MSISLHSPADKTPTRARLVVAAWLCGLSSILYLDRICMAQAVKPIRDRFGLSNTEMSCVAMAFTLAYGLCAVPIGRWGDKSGPRTVLTAIVLAWSAFTALTGAATGLVTLIGVRLMFGAAEAGAFPSAAKIMARWFPASERGRVQGVMLACAHVGAVIAPAGAAYLIDVAGWRWAFFAFGFLGVAWAAGFWFWFRDDPGKHPSVNNAEFMIIRADQWTPVPALRPQSSAKGFSETSAAGALTGGFGRHHPAGEGTGGTEIRDRNRTEIAPTPIDPGPVPWRAVAVNHGVIVLGLIMIIGAFYSYFFYSWFPTYLRDARGVENQKAGWLASLVIGGSAVGMLVGGWLADRFPHWTSNTVRARRCLGVASYITAATCMFFGLRCNGAVALACLWCASLCAMHLTLPTWWSAAIAQSGKHVGTLFALMNGVGVIGAMASQGFVGLFADWQKRHGLTGRAQWDPLFNVYVGVLLCGAIAWWLYRFTPMEEGAISSVSKE